MKMNLHNKLVVCLNGKEYIFYNQMFESVYEKIKNLDSYNNLIAIGKGERSSNQNNFKLTNYIKTFNLETETIQNDISKGELFIKKSLTINDGSLDGQYITEMGLCSCDEEPTIYNYFSLINEEHKGILKNKNESIQIYIYIYLELTYEKEGLFTLGNNPFISFLLGEGLNNKKIYISRGNNTSENIPISRAKLSTANKYLCDIKFNTNENSKFELILSSNLGSGSTYEIVYLIDDEPFARMNVLNIKNTISLTKDFEPKANYVLDLGDEISHINSITNSTTNETENNFYTTKYATKFGDKIILPFNNMFNFETPRFISKDGDKIFFVVNDTIYGYQNINYNLIQLNLSNLHIQNISKIVSFDRYLFVITKHSPYISLFIFDNGLLKKCKIDTKNSEIYKKLDDFYSIDITQAKNNIFMIGFISKHDNIGHTLYFNFNEENFSLEFDSYLETPYEINFMLAMYKNNFSDAVIIFLKEHQYSLYCRIINHFPDKSKTETQSVVAYYYTHDTKNIYTKNRAVIVEKNTTPYTWIYYYPQLYRYTLDLFETEHKINISTNLLYLIQQQDDKSYKIYNLVGYNIPTEFTDGFPEEIDQSKIIDFEFLTDTLLIFTNDTKENILAYNLNNLCTAIENVSSNNDTYSVNMDTYDIIGKNNEGVIASLTINFELWNLIIKSIKYLLEQM